MKCHYCGKEVWLVRHLIDGDFCSPAHRKKYNERLRRALDQLPAPEGPPASIAEFLFVTPPVDSEIANRRRTCGLQSSLPWPFLPQTTLGLAPLSSQAFFGPNVAMAPAAPAAGLTAIPKPIPAEPRLRLFRESWTCAAITKVEFADRLMAVNGLHGDPGRLSMPVYSTPQVSKAQPAQMICPKLGMNTVLADGLVAEESPARGTGANTNGLRHFIGATLDAAGIACRPKSFAEALAPVSSEVRNGRPKLRVTPCVLPIRVLPMLAGDTMAHGATALAGREAETVECHIGVLDPDLPGCDRPSPAGETEFLWKIAAATPWSLAQVASLESLAAQPAAVLLPSMTMAPVLPGLLADAEARRIEARLVGGVGRAYAVPPIPAANDRAAWTPAVPLPEMTAALPEATSPHSVAAESVTPRDSMPAPATGIGIPIEVRAKGGMLAHSLALCIDACAGTASQFRLSTGELLQHKMPAFIPQAATARSRGEISGAGCRMSALPLPNPARAGFVRVQLGGLTPTAAVIESKRVIPAPETVACRQVAAAEPGLSITSIGLPSLAGSIPLDVYVHRVKVASRRECEWRPIALAATAVPYVMPSLWPARFEQQVLQDWRRRYPARQAAVAPAPITSKAKVVPMSRQLGAFARLRQTAPHFVKGIGVAATISAVAWLAWSFKGVQTTVLTDRQWLRSAISQRAVRVVDDNFRSGMNLWEGRKNWAQSWSHSADGFARTGQLALYRPTLGMRDYRLEFFGQIESKSVGWVVRAKDEQNYYAMKLAVTEPGPRPLVSVVRYPVMGGKKGKRVQIPLPIMMHNNTPYHVAVDVKGNHFRAYIEDQEVDSWNDDRLRAGGVGFFSEAGEHARLYWVKVSKNTDWLGRLCGILSDGNAQDQAMSLWDPAAANQLAGLDTATILNGAKNADRRRGMQMLPFAIVLGGSL